MINKYIIEQRFPYTVQLNVFPLCFHFLLSSLAIAAVMPDQITKYEVEMKLYGSLSSLSAEESSTLVSGAIITIIVL